MIKYDIRIENRGCRDVFITGVDESDIRDTISSWCGENTQVVVTLAEDQGGSNET